MIETYEKRGVGGDCLRTGGMTRDFQSLRECVTNSCRRFGSNPFRCKKRVSGTTVFKTAAIDHSATSPNADAKIEEILNLQKEIKGFFQKRCICGS